MHGRRNHCPRARQNSVVTAMTLIVNLKVQWQWSDTKVILGIRYSAVFKLVYGFFRFNSATPLGGGGLGFSALPQCLGVYNEEIWG